MKGSRPAKILKDAHHVLDQLISAPAIHDLLELGVATVLDAKMHNGNKPVWLIPIARSGSGKTAICSALRGANTKFLTDLASPKSFLSALLDPRSGKRARSLLDEVNGLGVINPDLGAMLSGDPKQVKAMFGALRVIFDGTYEKGVGTSFGSSAVLEAKARFSLFACVTPQVWRKHQRVVEDLGTRELHAILPALSPEQRARGYELARNPERPELEARLQQVVNNLLTAVIAAPRPVHIPDAMHRWLQCYCDLIAAGRTPIRWERVMVEDEERGTEKQQWVWSPEACEDPYRTYQQLQSLLTHLTRLNGRIEPTDHELQLVHWVALSSASLDRAQMLLAMRHYPVVHDCYRGITVEGAFRTLEVSADQARQRLLEMERIGLLARIQVKFDPSKAGRPLTLYVPKTPDFEGVVYQEFSDNS